MKAGRRATVALQLGVWGWWWGVVGATGVTVYPPALVLSPSLHPWHVFSSCPLHLQPHKLGPCYLSRVKGFILAVYLALSLTCFVKVIFMLLAFVLKEVH